MDPVLPELHWVDGKCYRINDIQEIYKEEYTEHEDGYISPNMQDYDDDDEVDAEFITLTNGRVKTSIHIAQPFFGHIIGSKGITLKRLMNETCTDIKLPQRGSKGDVTITGPDKRKVTAAIRRIRMIVFAARQKMSPTHFISIPLTSKIIVDNYCKFKEDVLSNCSDESIDETIFMEPSKIHLTLTILSLMDQFEIDLACELLHEAKLKIVDPILKGKQIYICLNGITIMNDDPKKANVLYAKVEEKDECDNGILTNLFQQLNDFFAENGAYFDCFESARQGCKLHATLIKTSRRITENTKNQRKIPFDATKILDAHKDLKFGEHQVAEFHLSQMHSQNPDSYYISSTVIAV